MAVRKGEANMTRKASGTEKKKMSKRDEYMEAIEKADAEAVPLEGDLVEVLNALVRDEFDEDIPFEDLALEYAACTMQEGEAARRKDKLKKIFNKLLPMVGFDIGVVASDNVVVERTTGHTPRQLDPTKLLEHGVKLDIINECYVGGTEYKYTLVRLRKPKE